jgi:hypothetical protein
MILNSYIHQQLAAARRRDLVEAAERSRLGAQADEHEGARHPFGWALGRRGLRRRAAVDPRVCARSPGTVTR